MDGEVGIVLELELLLLLARDRDPVALVRVHLAGHHLLRLEPLFGSSAARGLSPLALSDSILLLFFELAAIHVLRGIGGPTNTNLGVVKKIRGREKGKKNGRTATCPDLAGGGCPGHPPSPASEGRLPSWWRDASSFCFCRPLCWPA